MFHQFLFFSGQNVNICTPKSSSTKFDYFPWLLHLSHAHFGCLLLNFVYTKEINLHCPMSIVSGVYVGGRHTEKKQKPAIGSCKINKCKFVFVISAINSVCTYVHLGWLYVGVDGYVSNEREQHKIYKFSLNRLKTGRFFPSSILSQNLLSFYFCHISLCFLCGQKHVEYCTEQKPLVLVNLKGIRFEIGKRFCVHEVKISSR